MSGHCVGVIVRDMDIVQNGVLMVFDCSIPLGTQITFYTYFHNFFFYSHFLLKFKVKDKKANIIMPAII